MATLEHKININHLANDEMVVNLKLTGVCRFKMKLIILKTCLWIIGILCFPVEVKIGE